MAEENNIYTKEALTQAESLVSDLIEKGNSLLDSLGENPAIPNVDGVTLLNERYEPALDELETTIRENISQSFNYEQVDARLREEFEAIENPTPEQLEQASQAILDNNHRLEELLDNSPELQQLEALQQRINEYQQSTPGIDGLLESTVTATPELEEVNTALRQTISESVNYEEIDAKLRADFEAIDNPTPQQLEQTTQAILENNDRLLNEFKNSEDLERVNEVLTQEEQIRQDIRDSVNYDAIDAQLRADFEAIDNPTPEQFEQTKQAILENNQKLEELLENSPELRELEEQQALLDQRQEARINTLTDNGTYDNIGSSERGIEDVKELEPTAEVAAQPQVREGDLFFNPDVNEPVVSSIEETSVSVSQQPDNGVVNDVTIPADATYYKVEEDSIFFNPDANEPVVETSTDVRVNSSESVQHDVTIPPDAEYHKVEEGSVFFNPDAQETTAPTNIFENPNPDVTPENNKISTAFEQEEFYDRHTDVLSGNIPDEQKEKIDSALAEFGDILRSHNNVDNVDVNAVDAPIATTGMDQSTRNTGIV